MNQISLGQIATKKKGEEMNKLLLIWKRKIGGTHIWYDPAFNEGEAMALFRQWAELINRFILWTVPFIALGALGYP